MPLLRLLLATTIAVGSLPVPTAAEVKPGGKDAAPKEKTAKAAEPGAGGSDKGSAFDLVSKHSDAAGAYKIDYAVPAAPAYSVLGATPSKELTAYFGRNVQWDILGKEDSPAAGVAIRPYWLLAGERQVLEDYQANPASQFAGAFVLSMAGGITGEKDKRSAGLALGVHTALTRGSDPRLDDFYIGCVEAVAEKTTLKRTAPAVTLIPKPAGEDAEGAKSAAGGKAGGGAVAANRDAKAEAAANLAADAREYLLNNDPDARRRSVDDRAALAVITRGLGQARSEEEVQAKFADYWTRARLGTAEEAKNAFAAIKVASASATASAADHPPAVAEGGPPPGGGGPIVGPFAAAAAEPDYTANDAEDAKLRSACMTVARLRYLNRREWLVGAGGTAKSPDTKFSDIEYGGVHLWSSYRIPIGRQEKGCLAAQAEATAAKDLLRVTRDKRCAAPFGNLAIFGRYIQDDKITIAKDTQEVADTYIAGGSFRKDAPDGKWGIGLSASYNSRDWHNAAFQTETFWRYSADLSYRVARGVFLNLQGGTVSGDPRGEDDFAIVRFTFQDGGN